MKEALKQAKKALEIGEVPIGCVIVRNGEIIGRGYNKRRKEGSVLGHAEIIAIKRACKKLGDWRMDDCDMYVTLEPCPMCAGAIVQARIRKVYMGAMNPKAGCAGSVMNILDEPGFNHQSEIVSGVLGEECSEILTAFFKKMREESKAKKKSQQNI